MNLKNTMWDKLQDEYRACLKCPIGEHALNHVMGKGHMQPDVVFIGEGPGRMEDIDGIPFVGQAGQLLAETIKRAGPSGKSGPKEPYPIRAFFTNLVACRPCDKVGGPNRAPSDKEISNCSDRLRQTIRILSPRIVVLLGRVPQKALKAARSSSSWLGPYLVFELDHPAYVLRHGGTKAGLLFQKYVAKMKEVVDACKKAA